MSKPKTERHLDICMALNNLYRKKNADYGDSFHKTFEEEGFAMARIRLSDKLNRFKTLSKQMEGEQNVQDESMRDTLLDLANYAIMTVLEMDGETETATLYADNAPITTFSTTPPVSVSKRIFECLDSEGRENERRV